MILHSYVKGFMQQISSFLTQDMSPSSFAKVHSEPCLQALVDVPSCWRVPSPLLEDFNDNE